jgi:hypothetical protein
VSSVLIVFIDSLPHALLGALPGLGGAREQWPIVPGFGYSANIHAELFAGLLPDDVGYFGEWGYDPTSSPGWRIRGLLPVLDALCRPYVLNRGLQHLLTRRYHPGTPMPNIRLRDLAKFALQGRHILDDPKGWPYPSLFRDYPQLQALSIPRVPRQERDQALVARGRELVDVADQLLLPLPDLDSFGHAYGIDHPVYRAHVARLDAWTGDLKQRFLARHRKGHVFVVSDHGMANVRRGVYLDIEEQIGRPGSESYDYFSDANLLRVWVHEPSLLPQVRAYLEGFGHGQLVGDVERERYGLTSSRFGQCIYVLEEGLAFEPSTFARHKPVGMHGYHPLAPGQQALLVHYGPPWQGRPPRRMRDVYRMMKAALGGTW